MIIEKQRINAHATIRTVAEIITAPYPTKTTIAAMIRRFDIRHPKVTYITMILTKLYRTINAFVATTTDKKKLCECIRRQSRSTTKKTSHYQSAGVWCHLRFTRLSRVAVTANDFPDTKSINQMMIVFWSTFSRKFEG
jgi:hypothetical protein